MIYYFLWAYRSAEWFCSSDWAWMISHGLTPMVVFGCWIRLGQIGLELPWLWWLSVSHILLTGDPVFVLMVVAGLQERELKHESTFSRFLLGSFATVLLAKSSPMTQSWGVGREATESMDTGQPLTGPLMKSLSLLHLYYQCLKIIPRFPLLH